MMNALLHKCRWQIRPWARDKSHKWFQKIVIYLVPLTPNMEIIRRCSRPIDGGCTVYEVAIEIVLQNKILTIEPNNDYIVSRSV
jgi:hypothetical protein